MKTRLKLMEAGAGDGGAGGGGGGTGGAGNGAGNGGAGTGDAGGSAGSLLPGAGGGGPLTGDSAWLNTITDTETRGAVLKMFPGMKGFEDLAKTAVSQQRLLGQPKVTLPTKPEERVPWMQKNFGAPVDGKGYKFDGLKIPAGVNLDQAALATFTEHFAKAGLTQDQMNGVMQPYIDSIAEQGTKQAAARLESAQKATAELQKEWGTDYQVKFSRAQLAIDRLGGKGLYEKVHAAGLTDDVTFVRFLANVGELMREDKASGGGAPGGFAAGPIEAKAEIARLEADPKFTEAYLNPQHQGYKEARTKMTRLFKIVNGEKID